MLPVLFLGAAAVGTAIAVAVYWKEIRAWLNRIWEKLPPSIKENLQGAKAFIDKIDNVFKNVMKYYSFNEQTQKWQETVVTKEVNQKDIPKDILEKFQARQKHSLDISTDIEKHLTAMTV